jgi:predicted RND superfamily exporter protein
MRSDMLAQTVLSSALVFLFLAWYTRSVAVPFLLLFPVVLSIVCGLAFGGWIVGPLSPLVVSVAAILVAQPIDFSLHFFSRWRDERRGCAPEEAVLRSQDSLERPFVGAATATMAAFLLLLTSRFSGFVHLGLLLFLGMLVLLAASLSLFPVMLLGAGRLLRPRPESTPWAVSAAVRVAGSRGRVVGAAAIVLLGLGSWAAVALGGVRIDLDVRNMMAPGDPGQATLERLERDLGTSLNPVFAIVRDDADLRGRLEGLRAKGVIGFADGAHELFPSPERAGRNARFLKETEGWVDGARSDLAALGFRPEAFRESLDALQAGLAASPSRAWLQEPAFAALEARFFYQGERVLHLLPLRSLWKPDERAAFDAAVRASLGEGTRFFSAFHLPDHYAGLLGRDLARVAGWSAAAVILITLLTLGNVVDGLVALAPVVVATGATLLCCVFLGGAINLMNMVAIPIVLGTGVDGGIHFMARFRELGRRDPVRALTDTGPGVWGSAVTTLLGFGAIGGSRTPGLSSMGMLVTAGTAVVLAATFFLLPVLAGTMSKHKDTK